MLVYLQNKQVMSTMVDGKEVKSSLKLPVFPKNFTANKLWLQWVNYEQVLVIKGQVVDELKRVHEQSVFWNVDRNMYCFFCFFFFNVATDALLLLPFLLKWCC